MGYMKMLSQTMSMNGIKPTMENVKVLTEKCSKCQREPLLQLDNGENCLKYCPKCESTFPCEK